MPYGPESVRKSITRSWRRIVTDHDPEWQRESVRPVEYEFSGDNKKTGITAERGPYAA